MDYALLLDSYVKHRDVGAWPRQRVLHECLREAIRSGALSTGTRLLATRALAQELGMARNSVLYAYDQLATEGYTRPGRQGTIVMPVSVSSPRGGATQAPAATLSRRAASLRTLAPPSGATTGFAPGVPALDEFPLALWKRTLERAWRSMPASGLNYGDPAGEPQLRAALADYLRGARGVQCDAGQVFITAGTQDSLDLCAHAFADAGDKVWIENPGYLGALAAFRGAQLKPIGIATDAHGINPDSADWRRHRPRFIYTTPSHQYPTGSVLSLERRLSLLAHARASGALIIEDDYDSEFRHDGPPLPAMQGLEDDAPVVYLGTFSKTMFPALRIGFLVTPPTLAEPLRALLARSAPSGRAAEQLALAAFVRDGQFAQHLRRMRRLYRQRRDALVAALEQELAGLGTVHGASAGMHLAFQLAGRGVSDVAVSEAARALSLVAPALSTHATGARANGWNGFLLGYAQVAAEDMGPLVATLAQLVRRAATASAMRGKP
ncbi:PLP-dependent aminotransferase family protein [Massilia sp. PAMC28688]|uniref:MocR-like pyridoxine biosynthesis transcription factor PdxR n=1 Tax=Massilia sp. PAMC28688 TaxID=2861283 RepID=UPI001C634750|nr:PLP-dependent aminotransferase family protein [Massilia sp. PAMC28688]QYF93905.1 PLP-dependent aminotransferase family protein [Massilia sp. PAMC28688]